ncbi:MAG TPA: hypothetical protein VLH79_06820 [Chthonomonadales bacterium]|nr:hypothetical protein [Chthonomonadales bacterium]
MRTLEAPIRRMMAARGLTEADIARHGGRFVDGWYEIEDRAHKAMMRATAAARPARPFGLGDAVAVVALPIARVLDAALGTDIAHCGGCEQRRAALNRIVPDLKP